MHFNLSFKQNLHRILVKLETENENLDVKIFITPLQLKSWTYYCVSIDDYGSMYVFQGHTDWNGSKRLVGKLYGWLAFFTIA